LVAVPLGTIAPSLTTPALAQTGDHAAYDELYAAIIKGADKKLMLDNAMVAIEREFNAVPDIAVAEALSPGLVAEIISEMRPVVELMSQRVEILYEPQIKALFAEHFNAEEARSVAAFYRSPLGRKMMAGVSRNYSLDNSLSDVMETPVITREQIEGDMVTTISATLGELTTEDFAELTRLSMQNPALLKLSSIQTKMVDLRTRMENEQPTAAEEAAIETAVAGVFERRFEQ
jgi:hypothetical protein